MEVVRMKAGDLTLHDNGTVVDAEGRIVVRFVYANKILSARLLEALRVMLETS
jgi:hypothetical protein